MQRKNLFYICLITSVLISVLSLITSGILIGYKTTQDVSKINELPSLLHTTSITIDPAENENVRNSPEVRKAMESYRKAHPVCEWDECSDEIEVHHIQPVSVRPDLAADTNNMISLGAKRCHLCVGHAGNYRLHYISNIKEICKLRKIENDKTINIKP